MKWLWLDPGETIGWARGIVSDEISESDGTIVAPAHLLVEEWGQHKSRTFLLQLVKSAKDYDLIGYENYTIRADKWSAHVGTAVPTLQVIGGIRLAVWLAQIDNGTGFPVLEEQVPRDKGTGMASAKVHVPELVPVIAEALKGKHDDGHYGDAILHAVRWFHVNYRGLAA